MHLRSHNSPYPPRLVRRLVQGFTLSALSLLVFLLSPPVDAQSVPPDRISHYGQPVFVAGANVAYLRFEADVGLSFCIAGTYPCGTSQFTIPDPNLDNQSVEDKFIEMLDAIKAAGGNTVRWWVHVGANFSPLFDQSTGEVNGISPETLDDVERALDLARDRDMFVIPTLFSFQLVNEPSNAYLPSPELVIAPKTTEGGRDLLIEDNHLDQYIQNALIPLVTHVGNHPALLAWDLINEPEGATQIGFIKFKQRRLPAVRLLPNGDKQLFKLNNAQTQWIEVDEDNNAINNGANNFAVNDPTQTKPNPLYFIQRFASRTAKAIKENVPGVKVTLTAHFFARASDVNQGVGAFVENYYTDVKLAAAGGETGPQPVGVLDFIMVNYYTQHFSKINSPFHYPATHWGVGKPIVVGEFVADGIDPFTSPGDQFECGDTVFINALFPKLHQTDYAGGLIWSYTESWDTTVQRVKCNSPQVKSCAPNANNSCLCVPEFDVTPTCNNSGNFFDTFSCSDSGGNPCSACTCAAKEKTMTMKKALKNGRHLEDVAIVSIEAEHPGNDLDNVQVECPTSTTLTTACGEPNTSAGSYVRIWPRYQRSLAVSFETSRFPIGVQEQVPIVNGIKLLEFVVRIRYRVPQQVEKVFTFEVDGITYSTFSIPFAATNGWAILEVPAFLPAASTVSVRVANPADTSGLMPGPHKLDIDRISISRIPTP
ncbi:MAG: hypothetical protein AAGD38_21270 [Acidobacteriota bacterium]